MISFIIPAYNEEQLLGDTISAIHSSASAVGEPYEIIVADDASTDQTAVVAEKNGAHVVRVANRQIAKTRNSGARAAKGDLLIFVDADTLVNAAVIRAAVKALHSGAIGGGSAVVFDDPVPRYAHFLILPMTAIFRAAGMACGCFVYCTRAAFEAVGGFNEGLFGAEELAISQALKRQGRFVVLRQAVTTSGRKLRAYSGWEILKLFGNFARRGPSSVRDRSNMDIWYGERRTDPGREFGRQVKKP